MGKIIAYGSIKDGKLTIRNRHRFDEELNSTKDMEVVITVEKYVAKRSTAQNALWWVYMGILSKELGYHREEIHEICKFKSLKRQKVIESTSEVVEYLESTTKLNKAEFGTLIDSLIIWAAELNIVLPEPNEQFKLME